MTYQEYLLSPEWSIIREQRLAMDNHECVLCGVAAEQVHHRRYPKVLGTETVNDLVSLCDLCHAKHHALSPGQRERIHRIPITDDMVLMKREMRKAEEDGDEGKSIDLFVRYVSTRKAQLIGV
jgi:5-methylcytosine-specific restriction endonuclease McrA